MLDLVVFGSFIRADGVATVNQGPDNPEFMLSWLVAAVLQVLVRVGGLSIH